MGAYRGNADRVMADAVEIARRLREGDTRITRLCREYRCAYPTMMRTVLSQMTKRQWKQIRRRILPRGGIKTRFQKGHVPWSKGRKGVHHSPATEFKKGCLPVNHKPVGTVMVRNDKCGRQFHWTKISGIEQGRHKWIPYARHVWQKEHGPVPQGCFVVHVDGNTLNDSLENLRVVNRRQHLALQMKRDPRMLQKCRRNSARASKKRHRLNRLRKAKAAKEAARRRQYELKVRQRAERQAAQEAEDRSRVEAGRAQLRGQVTTRWQCWGCGEDYGDTHPSVCPKCNGRLFEQIMGAA